MKIEQQDIEPFKPIKLTLETKEEAIFLSSIMSHILGSGKVREFTDEICTALNNLDIGYKTLVWLN